MPASIHPPVQLHIVLDEGSYQGGDSVEMARRFTAVAPTEIVRASKGSQRANVLRFDLGDDAVTAEAEADPLWRDALTTWLDEEFDETSALVARENDARQNNGERPLTFTWAEVKFGSGPVIAIRMKDSAIPPEAAGFVARARELLAAGTFGADPIAAIRIPACASIEAQRSEAGADEDGEARESEPVHRHTYEASYYSEMVEDDDLRRLRAVGKEERGSGSADDIIAAVSAAAGLDRDPRGSASFDPDEQNAWATTEVEHDGPSRSELDEALAEAEAALRRGDSVIDVDAEDDGGAAGAGDADVDAEVSDRRVSSEDVDTSGEGCALSDEGVPSTLDYRIWNVAYADGTSVRYDSVMGEALLD